MTADDGRRRRIELSAENLGRLDPRISIPAYDRSALGGGIVHIGVGGFHRAHQAVYLDDVCGAGVTDWSITGAGVLSGGRGDGRRSRCPGLPLRAGDPRRARHERARHRLHHRLRACRRRHRAAGGAHRQPGHAHRVDDHHRGRLPRRREQRRVPGAAGRRAAARVRVAGTRLPATARRGPRWPDRAELRQRHGQRRRGTDGHARRLRHGRARPRTLGRPTTSPSPTAWSTASRRRRPTPIAPSSRRSTAWSTAGRSWPRPSSSGSSRTSSPMAGRPTRTSAC